MIHMNDFHREYAYHKREISMAVQRTLDSGWYILGKEVENFEKHFAEFTGTRYAIGVANGLDALHISLLALGVGRGDEVITVAHSAVATALAITNTGATIRFVDIDQYYHMDPLQLERAINNKTRAIIPVHLYGQIADMHAIMDIAEKYNIPVIEDACQAHGARYQEKFAGSFGTFGCFSFYPTKNLGAYGDGGAITTNSQELFESCKMLRNYGQQVRYHHLQKGINSRLDELQAAILSAKLPHLNELITRRIQLAQTYFTGLEGVGDVILPEIRKNAYAAYHLYVIRTSYRDALKQFLHQKGIETHIHYPVPIHKQVCYPEYNDVSLPQTEQAANDILSLPMNPFLTQNEAENVIKTIRSFYELSRA